MCVCVDADTCNFSGLIPGNCEISLKPIDSYPCKYVLPTIYKTSQGALINENSSPVGVGSATSDDMLTLAVRVQGQENRVKVGLRNVSVR